MKTQEELIIINKNLFLKIWNFLKHPITSLILGILISYIFYLVSLNSKIPSYFVTHPTLVATKSSEDLRITFKGKEYPNIYFRKLIIWNEGSEYIDSQDFIDSKPLKLYSSEKVEILAVTTLKSSREDLQFENNIINNQSVTFKILNDEAMEESDGVCFHVLYSDAQNGRSKFVLESRIKGTIEGFQFKDLRDIKTKSNKISLFILWGIIFLILIGRVVTLLAFKKNIVFRKWEAVFLIVLLSLTIYETIYYIFYSTNLNWYT